MDLNPEPISPRRIIDEALELFSPEAKAKGVALRTEGLTWLPAELMIDGGRLRQVLLELIGNAVKVTQAGSITVSAAYDDIDQRLSLSVADTGLPREPGGSGLGLTNCKGLIEAMGGQVSVISVPGRGACFSFDIAAPQAAEAPAAPRAAAPSLPPACRVLIVDDNRANRDQVNAVLTALGAHVAEAVDGEEGVAAANTSAYDVILMDLRMPCLDGVQAAQRIRDGGGPNAAAPIIAFSADARPGAPGGVFDGAVSKPMTAAGLIRALDSAMAAPVARTLEAFRSKTTDR